MCKELNRYRLRNHWVRIGIDMDTFELWMDNSWQKNVHDRKEIMDIKKVACICP